MQPRLEHEQSLFQLFNRSQRLAGLNQCYRRNDKHDYDNNQKQQNQTAHKMSCYRSLL